ncbi:MAG: hypothetical protein MI700_04480 [Balneolales bacterium]|nr:hypothetical protein [Balneolales bacterium]
MLVGFGVSCSPASNLVTNSPFEPWIEDEFVLVLDVRDNFKNDGHKIGTIKTADPDSITNCSQSGLLKNLRQKARKHGANVVKIMEYETSDAPNACPGISADIFRVPDFRKHERAIEWSPDRRLSWQDFKGDSRFSSNKSFSAESFITLKVEQDYYSKPFSSNILVINKFETNLSWVRQDQNHRQDLLIHEEFHFHLSEVYARKMRKEFFDLQLNMEEDRMEIDSIFTEIRADYLRRQERYDLITDHGKKKKEQREWERAIERELIQYQAFKRE